MVFVACITGPLPLFSPSKVKPPLGRTTRQFHAKTKRWKQTIAQTLATLQHQYDNKANFMTTRAITGALSTAIAKLKQKWAKLTAHHRQQAEGNLDELIIQIQRHTGETREAVEKAIHEFLSDTRCK